MDVVYLCRGERNQELRYSLRSLVNMPHDRVFVAGQAPGWARVQRIEVAQGRRIYENTTANLLAAAQRAEVSESFVLMNDDFFVMEPVEEVPVLHAGTIASTLEGHARRGATSYVAALRQMRRYLLTDGVEPLSYELHVPMVMTKAGVEEILALDCPPAIVHPLKRTLYGNHFNLGGTQSTDVKLRRAGDVVHGPFWSAGDGAFKRSSGEPIRAAFPDPGRYER